ncbi:MAG: hypothetical protein SCH39_08310 [Methanosarcinales archaeon]|nr:hypothetical protein [ANME-2 cluster archaeon]MDW7776319.1 hypothetical protein [Methanosarcinales archaeon]
MANDNDVTDEELEEILLLQAEQQPAKCRMKRVKKLITNKIVPPDEGL